MSRAHPIKPFGNGVLLSAERSLYIQCLGVEQRDKLIAAIVKRIRCRAASRNDARSTPRDWYR